jgi:hypothetical protein
LFLASALRQQAFDQTAILPVSPTVLAGVGHDVAQRARDLVEHGF